MEKNNSKEFIIIIIKIIGIIIGIIPIWLNSLGIRLRSWLTTPLEHSIKSTPIKLV